MSNRIPVGSRVRHKEYGNGTVVWDDRSSIPYAVRFDKKYSDLNTLGNCGAPEVEHGHGSWCYPEDLTILSNPIEALTARIEALECEVAALKATPKEAPEVGLRPGDYCDASKEVADELTVMGFGWHDEDRHSLAYITPSSGECNEMLNTPEKDVTHLDSATFLSRARVTAKALGLKPPAPWTPKFGDRVMTPGGEGIYWREWDGLPLSREVIQPDVAHFYAITQLTPIN
jgi:hypothetical protein